MSHRPRILVVNADDFGLSTAVNRGVIEGHEKGIVTSASLMVLGEGAENAAAYGRRSDSLAVGLHLDLGHWEFSDGNWKSVYARVSPDDPDAVREEVERQLQLFQQLLGRAPTHLDSHQHVHLEEPTATALRELSAALGVPLRGSSACIRHRGEFYGQTVTGEPLPELITAERLIEIIASIEPGVSELACHPGRGVGDESSYSAERERELEALCDPRVWVAIDAHRIALRSFADIGPEAAP